MKTSELTGVALDWAVAKCEGNTFAGEYPHLLESGFRPPRYSTDWAQGGPIIEKEGMDLEFRPMGSMHEWVALNEDWFCGGPTPLIAAMRCYVASKLGDEIELPTCFI